jgi:tetratricopeptide (TPR) repeat protein
VREVAERPGTLRLPLGGGAALVFVFALVLYANTLGNSFVFNDSTLIVQNPRIVGMRSWPKLFTQGYWPEELGEKLYRPLTLLSYGVNLRFLGHLNPSPYHVVNVFLHAANSALVCALVLALFGQQRRLLALAAGLIFAVHPIQADAVAPIYGRAELLSTVFYLLTLLLWTRADPARPLEKNTGLALGCFALGLLAKESAITLLAAAPLCDWVLGRFRRENTQTLAIRYAGLAGVVVLYLILSAHALATLTTAQFYYSQPRLFDPLPWPSTVTSAECLATACTVLGRYVLLLVWPARLSPDYSYAAVTVANSLASPAVLLSLAGALATIVVAIWIARRNQLVAFAILFFWSAYHAVSNLVGPTSAWMAERFLYLPMVGVAVLAGLGAEWVTKRVRPDTVALGLLAGILVLLAGRTYLRNRDWRDGPTLWASAVRAQPRSVVALHNWGEMLLAGGKPGEAVPVFESVLKIVPEMADSENAMSRALLQLQKFDDAAAAARRALALRLNFAQAYNNLALALMSKGDYAGGVEQLRLATSAEPDFYDAWNNLGVALFNSGKFDEAIEAYKKALEVYPGYASCHFNYGLVLLRLERTADAAQQFSEALRENPSLMIARLYLAETKGRLGDLAGAERELLAGAQAEPNRPEFYAALAQVYTMMGKSNDAMQATAKARQLQSQPSR